MVVSIYKSAEVGAGELGWGFNAFLGLETAPSRRAPRIVCGLRFHLAGPGVRVAF